MNLKDTAVNIDGCAAWINGDEEYNLDMVAESLSQCAMECRKADRVLTAARKLLSLDPRAQPIAYGHAWHALVEAVAACSSEVEPENSELGGVVPAPGRERFVNNLQTQ